MKLNGSFFPIPSIVLNDNKLKYKDIVLLAVIIPLTYEKGYCFATNDYLADKLNTSTRTINVALANLRKQEWIKTMMVKNRRRIYLNMDKGLITTEDSVAENYSLTIDETSKYNKKEIKEKNKRKDIKKENYEDLKQVTDYTPVWMKKLNMYNSGKISDTYNYELDQEIEEY